MSAPTSQLKTLDGPVLCQGSWRTCFQPLTPSRPRSISARKRGISRGSSCRSASSVTTSSPWAASKPALRAAALPKLRRKRMPRTRGSACGQPLDQGPRSVGRAVVDEDDFEVVAMFAGDGGQLAVQSVSRLSTSSRTGMTAESMGSTSVVSGQWSGRVRSRSRSRPRPRPRPRIGTKVEGRRRSEVGSGDHFPLPG